MSRNQHIVEPVATWTLEQLKKEQETCENILAKGENETFRTFLNEIEAELERRKQSA